MTIDTTYLDSDTDSIMLARPALLAIAKKANESVSASEYGLIGDGSDEAVKIAAFMAAAVTADIAYLGRGKTYSYTGTINFPAGVSLITNSSQFQKLATDGGWAAQVNDNVTIDRLKILTAGGATDKGIYISGAAVEIQRVYCYAATTESGSTGSDINGLLVGHAAVLTEGVKLGGVGLRNWDRAMQIRNQDGAEINNILIDQYRRGVYVKDCKNSYFNNALICGLSANSTGGPGDNGLLIESTSDYASTNLHFTGWRVTEPGEHAYRLGGQYRITNAWFTNCSAWDTGKGATATGGCGFKVQGSDGTNVHEFIYLTNFIHRNGKAIGGNFCGILFALVNGGKIDNPLIDSTTAAASTWHGISFLSCKDVSVTNPTVKKAGQHALRLYSAAALGFPLGQSDVVIHGGTLENISTATSPVISLEGTDTIFTRCGVRGTSVTGGTVAATAEVPVTGGGYSDCFLDLTYSQSTGAGAHLIGTSNFLVDLTVPAANLATAAKTGSVQRVSAGRMYIKESGGWGAPATSFTTVLGNDTVTTWVPPNTSQFVFVTLPSVSYYGYAWVRSTATPASAKVTGGANFLVANTALTGTTGVSGNLTLGVQNGQLQIENRTGAAQTITVTQLA